MNSMGTDILLAEESPEEAEVTIRALRRENVAENIFVARDGEQALDFIFCRSKFASRSPDPPKLILLDLKLPRVNGLEVLKQLKDDPRTKAIPAVILTSSQEEGALVRSYDLGANSYILKPVDFEQLGRTMRTVGMYWMVINLLPNANQAKKSAGRSGS